MAPLVNKKFNTEHNIHFRGVKFISIIVVGFIIGFAASEFVEPPPSVKLLLNTQHNKESGDIIRKLDAMELDVISIKDDILYIKQQLEQNTNKEE